MKVDACADKPAVPLWYKIFMNSSIHPSEFQHSQYEMDGQPIAEPIDPDAFTEPADVEKKSTGVVGIPDESLVEAPPMTFKRLMVLFSLANLFIGAGVAFLFLGAGLSILLTSVHSDGRRLHCR
jgi:hypothetical protein